MHESEVAQLCLTLSDPMDCNLPGSSVHGIFQARVLELGAIAFSEGLPQRRFQMAKKQKPRFSSPLVMMFNNEVSAVGLPWRSSA